MGLVGSADAAKWAPSATPTEPDGPDRQCRQRSQMGPWEMPQGSLGVHGGSLGAPRGVLGGPLGIPGSPWETLGGDPGDPWGIPGDSLGGLQMLPGSLLVFQRQSKNIEKT